MTRITIDRAVVEHALEAFELVTDLTNHDDEIYDAIAALRAALATGDNLSPTEPVAWMYEDTLPKEYPYDTMWPHSAVRDGVRMFPVFAPPQRKPLTEEEMRRLADKYLFYQPESYEVSGVFAFAREIERAHGITL